MAISHADPSQLNDMVGTDMPGGKSDAAMHHSLGRRLLIELAVLAGLTAAVVLLFPQRPAWLNGLLALLGLALIVINRRATREIVWQRFPVAHDRRYCIVHTIVIVGLFTLAGLLLLALLAWWQAGPNTVRDPAWLGALPIYLLWGLLQQYLFQYYLLGRLLVRMPVARAVFCTGLAFALVHFPDVATMAVTLAAGMVWTAVYYRYRVLMPLAASHAVLGTALFYWVYHRDILAQWRQMAF
jgi:membrane protease YdiL (CAAX protease family)